MDVAEEARRLYEQIGALYLMAEHAEEAAAPAESEAWQSGHATEQLADFLATVHEVARTAMARGAMRQADALATAIRRYERDRTGGQVGA